MKPSDAHPGVVYFAGELENFPHVPARVCSRVHAEERFETLAPNGALRLVYLG